MYTFSSHIVLHSNDSKWGRTRSPLDYSGVSLYELGRTESRLPGTQAGLGTTCQKHCWPRPVPGPRRGLNRFEEEDTPGQDAPWSVSWDRALTCPALEAWMGYGEKHHYIVSTMSIANISRGCFFKHYHNKCTRSSCPFIHSPSIY